MELPHLERAILLMIDDILLISILHILILSFGMNRHPVGARTCSARSSCGATLVDLDLLSTEWPFDLHASCLWPLEASSLGLSWLPIDLSPLFFILWRRPLLLSFLLNQSKVLMLYMGGLFSLLEIFPLETIINKFLSALLGSIDIYYLLFQVILELFILGIKIQAGGNNIMFFAPFIRHFFYFFIRSYLFSTPLNHSFMDCRHLKISSLVIIHVNSFFFCPHLSLDIVCSLLLEPLFDISSS